MKAILLVIFALIAMSFAQTNPTNATILLSTGNTSNTIFFSLSFSITIYKLYIYIYSIKSTTSKIKKKPLIFLFTTLLFLFKNQNVQAQQLLDLISLELATMELILF
jgi:hypothetical protein